MKEKKDNSAKKPNKSLKNLAQFSGIAFQMGATIFAAAYFGKWLDEKYPSDRKWFTMLCSILGVIVSLYVVLKQLNKYNESDKE